MSERDQPSTDKTSDAPTPRTDANLRGWEMDIPTPFAEFTRQLERELAVAHEEQERLRAGWINADKIALQERLAIPSAGTRIAEDAAVAVILKEMAWGDDCREDAVQLYRAIMNAAPETPGSGASTRSAGQNVVADGRGQPEEKIGLHGDVAGGRDTHSMRSATNDQQAGHVPPALHTSAQSASTSTMPPDDHHQRPGAIGMKYTEICEAKSKEQMQALFAQHLMDCAEEFGGTPKSHRAIQLSNVGYFSGYYSSDTARRILDWLGTAHPIFGTAHAEGTLDPADAFAAGVKLAKENTTDSVPDSRMLKNNSTEEQ